MIDGTAYGSNLDGTVLEVNPFSTPHQVYMIGGMGPPCAGGGINVQAIYNLGADGSAQSFVGYAPGAWDRVEAKFTTDGAIVLFGCDGTTPQLWSGYPDATGKFVATSSGNPCNTNPPSIFCTANSSIKKVSTPSLPACSESSVFSGVPMITRRQSSMSRVNDGTLSSEYNYIRLAYLANSGQVQRAYAYLAKSQSNPSGVVLQGQQPLMTAGDAAFRLNFVDPDNEENKLSFLPNVSALYWSEGQGSTPSFNMGYGAVTGLGNYTLSHFLNVTAGAPAPWTFSSGVFTGDFDRGSFYVKTNPVVNNTATYNYFLQWPESTSGTANESIHYNVVQATEPRFTWSQVSSVAMGTDPAAARLVDASGVTKIHVVAADSAGTIKRIVYSDDTQTWSVWSAVGSGRTTSLPVAAVSWGTGRLDVVAIGSDKNMYQFAEQDGFPVTNWAGIGTAGGGFIEAPTITSSASGKLFIAAIGSDTGVYYKSWNMAVPNGWSAWARLANGNAIGGPAAISLNSNRIDVFVRGLGGDVYQYQANNDGSAGWEGRGSWASLGSVIHGGLTASISAAVRDGANTVLDLFSTDGNHPFANGHLDTAGSPQIMHAWYSSGWSDWHTIGGLAPGDGAHSPFRTTAAVSLSTTKARVLTRGLDGSLWWAKWDS